MSDITWEAAFRDLVAIVDGDGGQYQTADASVRDTLDRAVERVCRERLLRQETQALNRALERSIERIRADLDATRDALALARDDLARVPRASMRDAIAARVASGLAQTHRNPEGVASTAYEIADAMITHAEKGR